jgi:cytochrome c-type protein NapC
MRRRNHLRRRCTGLATFSAIALLLAGILSGILLWGGFNTVLEWTNRMDFCLGCHEMADTVYPEYQETVHFRNASGVQATCADCHVPRPWGQKVWRKIQATGEVYHKIVGTIDTPEKFEAHRWVMANRVWDQMQANDSRECRNCHSFTDMDLSEQDRYARKRHSRAIDAGQTCIDCHQGIAHRLPRKPEPEDTIAGEAQ